MKEFLTEKEIIKLYPIEDDLEFARAIEKAVCKKIKKELGDTYISEFDEISDNLPDYGGYSFGKALGKWLFE